MHEPPNDLWAPRNDEERVGTTAWWVLINDGAPFELVRMWAVAAVAPALAVRGVRVLARATLVLLAMASAACSNEPQTCEEADCDPTLEFCRFFGSDTLAPSTASCSAFPAPCATEPTCECLLENEDENSIATCDDSGDVLVMTVPGG